MIIIKCLVLDKFGGTKKLTLKVNSKTKEEAIRRISNYYIIMKYEVVGKKEELTMFEEGSIV